MVRSGPTVASPSLSMERGTYRMRAPPTRSPAADNYRASPRPRGGGDRLTVQMAAIIVILAIACLSSFGTAYYLLTSRWDSNTIDIPSHAHAPTQDAPAKPAMEPKPSMSNTLSQQRYLAYLPHSGFHNQRIALENALIIARILNRTLLVPPARLGNKPLAYRPFNNLYRYLEVSDKTGFSHCIKVPSHVTLPPECSDYFDYTHIPWQDLIDLTALQGVQQLHHRPNMTRAWLYDHLRISTKDTLLLQDKSPYHFCILDDKNDALPRRTKYEEALYLQDLAPSERRLIHFGTLFGSGRLRLKLPQNIVIQQEVRQRMHITNPDLLQVANAIVQRIGGLYLAVHLRLSDGQFRDNQAAIVRSAWWDLVHSALQYTGNQTLVLESRLLHLSPDQTNSRPIPLSNYPKRIHRGGNLPSFLAPNHGPPPSQCKFPLHTDPHLGRLNFPLFIASDLKGTNEHPLLERFRKTFPCALFLSDFWNETKSLQRLLNEDGVNLNAFYIPLLDAIVAGNAVAVVGTRASTFSQYVHDILWPTYHNLTSATPLN